MASQEQLRDLEKSSYYAVLKALYACGRLETFENELLLTDLQETLNIELNEHLAFLEQVQKDSEASQLANFGKAVVDVAPARVMAASRPYAPAIVLPSYETPFHGAPSSKIKSKKPTPTGGIVKGGGGGGLKKSKSIASTPSTPRGLQAKGSFKGADKRASGGVVAVPASQAKSMERAQMDLDRLNERERQIFEELIRIGVEDNDPELNDVQRTLLKWYRYDIRQREIEVELGMI